MPPRSVPTDRKAGLVPAAVAAEGLGRIEDAQGLLVAALPGKITGTQQRDVLGRGAGLGAIKKLLRLCQIAASLVQGRPVSQCLRIRGRALVGLGEVTVGLLDAPLFHEIEPEVHVVDRLRLPEREGPPEVPLARGQVVHLGEDQAEGVVAARGIRIRPHTGPCHLLGVCQATVRQQQLDELAVSPVGLRVDSDHRLQRTRRFAKLSPALQEEATQRQGVDVATRGLQALVDGGLGRPHVASCQSLASAENESMGWIGHSMSLIGKQMRGWPCALALTLAGGLAAAQPAPQSSSAQVDIIPAPAHVESRSGSFTVRVDATISHPRDPEAERIARYFAQLLMQTRGMPLRVSERAGQATAADAIIFRLDPFISIPDSQGYEIDISPSRIMLSARDSQGLFYAAVTLWELCTARAGRGDDEILLPAMRITDAPRFRWRGLMLDSARHYQSPDFIMHLIDWMALHKLNVLQWHLTDDQGWRLEIKRYPRLTSVGAWRVPAGPAAAADIDPAPVNRASMEASIRRRRCGRSWRTRRSAL